PVIQVNPGPRGTVTWPLKDLKFSNLSSRSLTQKAPVEIAEVRVALLPDLHQQKVDVDSCKISKSLKLG
mgnify:CR=1